MPSLHLHLHRPFPPPLKPSSSSLLSHTLTRSASLLRRPKRPYTFTQLVQLSDGSTYTQRTTSPQAVYRSNKDTRNTPLWNPTSAKLLNLEADEAGRLRAFREKFGRGWDVERMDVDDGEEGGREESLMDLITGYGEGEGEGKGGKGGKEVDGG